MPYDTIEPSVRTKHPVRQSLIFLSLLFTGLSYAENLPEIDARQFEVSPTQVSSSGRIYKFRVSGRVPRTGNILLIQIDQRPVMAFRVLTSEESGSEVVAKRVRRYDVEGKLTIDQRYQAVEKIADLVQTPETAAEATAPGGPAPAPSTESPRDSSPAQEGTPAQSADAPPLMGDDGSSAPPPDAKKQAPNSLDKFDEELDSTTTPRNLKKPAEDGDDTEESEESRLSRQGGPGVEEREPLIKTKHMLGLSIGNYRNLSNFVIPGSTNNGFSVYYSQIIDKGIWYSGWAPHDSLSLEGGLTYYQRVNYSGIYDNYTLIPLRADALYTLQFTPTFALIAGAGIQYNWILSTDNAAQEGITALGGFQPNAYGGILYNIGPQWYLRAEAGLDRIAVGLAVKW